MAQKISEQKLEDLTYQLRRTAVHQENDTEAETKKMITRAYKDILDKVSQYYGKYGTSEGLDGTTLRRVGQYKTFFQQAVSGCQNITAETRKTLEDAIEKSYQLCYDGVLDAVHTATDKDGKTDGDVLKKQFDGLKATTSETLTEVVTNKTMTDALKNYSADAVTQIRKTLTAGLASGDSYDRMAQRIEKCANRTYNKALTIARTECNRAINQGMQDAAVAANPYLQQAGYVEVKVWHSMEDELVRDTHQHLDGKTVYVTDEFESSGATAQCPGGFGVAGEDINCRCFLEYTLMPTKEFVTAGGTFPDDLTYMGDEQIVTKEREKELTDAFERDIIGVETANGVTVTGVTKHFYAQSKTRFIPLQVVKSVLINPIHTVAARADKNGWRSQKLIGEAATVAINPDTGVLVTIHGTHDKIRRKYMEGGGKK